MDGPAIPAKPVFRRHPASRTLKGWRDVVVKKMRHEWINLARRRPWGGRVGRCAGLTLTELLIVVVILGILGAMVLPKFSDSTSITRELTLKDDLLYLRTQIIVFKAQHGDTAPGYPNRKSTASPTEQDFILQMTRHTDEFCNFVSPTTANRLGPYIKKMPVNPLNGMNTILIVPNG